MLYIAGMVILGDHGIEKISFKNFEPSKMKNCIGRLCTGPFTHVSHYWCHFTFLVKTVISLFWHGF